MPLPLRAELLPGLFFEVIKPLIPLFLSDSIVNGEDQKFFLDFLCDGFVSALVRWLSVENETTAEDFVGHLKKFCSSSPGKFFRSWGRCLRHRYRKLTIKGWLSLLTAGPFIVIADAVHPSFFYSTGNAAMPARHRGCRETGRWRSGTQERRKPRSRRLHRCQKTEKTHTLQRDSEGHGITAASVCIRAVAAWYPEGLRRLSRQTGAREPYTSS